MKGLFITLEGIEGAGKTTAMAALERYFTERGRTCLRTREPGGTALGEHIRAWLLDRSSSAQANTEALLVFAARAQHLAEVIQPALASGQVVLCDRFTDATYAYQGAARGLGFERIAVLEQWVQGTLRPDLTFLLDITVAGGAERVAGRGDAPDRFEREPPGFFEQVRAGYLKRAAEEPHRIRIIDAACTVAEVEQELHKILREMSL
ncbi:MAG: dTMP kinase [Acidiferrobacteraceae bacterium]